MQLSSSHCSVRRGPVRCDGVLGLAPCREASTVLLGPKDPDAHVGLHSLASAATMWQGAARA
eukprot:6474214-Amphidinium_carterae.1